MGIKLENNSCKRPKSAKLNKTSLLELYPISWEMAKETSGERSRAPHGDSKLDNNSSYNSAEEISASKTGLSTSKQV